MNSNSNPRLWMFLGNILWLLCTPLGLYTMFQSIKISSSIRINDIERVNLCVKRIKNCWIAAGIFWILIIVLGVTGVFD